MKRKDWVFTYSCADLLKAATEKRDYHQKRVEWWDSKKKEVIEKVKAEGLEIDESLAEGFKSASNYVRGPQVMVRTDLQADLNESVERLKANRELVKQYNGWIEVLTANPNVSQDLDLDDWLFFFSKD